MTKRLNLLPENHLHTLELKHTILLFSIRDALRYFLNYTMAPFGIRQWKSSNIGLSGPIHSLNWLSGMESLTIESKKRLRKVRAVTASLKTATNEREVTVSSSENANKDHENKD